ncbi:unnamed protein product [Trichobilharzia szidati]|nr:unnamed protein product [Trichobilharzia szidati]
MCKAGESYGDWFIQRGRLGSGQGDLKGYVKPNPVSAEYIRLRLRKRIWQNLSTVASALPLLYGNSQFQTENISEAESEVRKPLSLYFTVSKPGQPLDVIKTEKRKLLGKTRTHIDKDTFYIRRAKFDDTGVYKCLFKGKELRVWAVTVLKPGDEPFRNIFLPLERITENSTTTLNNSITTDSSLQPLATQFLVSNNLKLLTQWSSWSDCIPCTPKEYLNSLSESKISGIQIKVGICHVAPIDRSYAIQPHMLAIETGETLNLYNDPGLPCRSHLIRDSLLKYGPMEFHKRPSELKIRRCIQTCSGEEKNVASFTSVLSRVQRYPKHVTMRVNEGERLVITCPVRNSPEKPITWFYAPENTEELMELTKTAYNLSIIRQYGSSTRYLATKLKQIDFTTLIKETRGRYKLDSAFNIIVAETVSIRNEKYKGLHHLICVHGDACAVRYDNNKNNSDDLITNNNDIYGEWSCIIHIDTIPRSGFVIFLSKLTPVVQLLIPFILALGLFFIVILTLYTERKPKMRLAANGMIIK